MPAGLIKVNTRSEMRGAQADVETLDQIGVVDHDGVGRHRVIHERHRPGGVEIQRGDRRRIEGEVDADMNDLRGRLIGIEEADEITSRCQRRAVGNGVARRRAEIEIGFGQIIRGGRLRLRGQI